MMASLRIAVALTLSLAVPVPEYAGGATVQKPTVGRAVASREKPQAGLPLARIVWLEAATGAQQQPEGLPVFGQIDPKDARLKDYGRWIDTEAARFVRRLIYRASLRFGNDPIFREPVLPVVIRKGGNNAAYGLAIATAQGIEEHPRLPYIILDSSPARLGDTILHESGHLLHSLGTGGRRGGSSWSAFPHTTFATSDPITALSEGYAIHFETLWGHFGADPNKQAYYRRLAPSFDPGKGRNAAYFAPVDDLMNFAQVWSRYQAVRDTLPAFDGHLYPGAYPRTQMDPERDCARLKSPNAMIASEGVVASTFFWISSAVAQEKGARPAGGLEQPALLDAEMTLLEALAAVPAPDGKPFRPDVVDVVEALARRDPHVGEIAVSRFVDVTRGVTARPAIRERWRTLYDAAIMLDLDAAKALLAQMDEERGRIVEQAKRDILSLRAGVGPVIPVSVQGAMFEMKGLGEKLAIEFDLNAMSVGEMALLPALDVGAQALIERERQRAPFGSPADFTTRTGLSLERLGLVEVATTRPQRQSGGPCPGVVPARRSPQKGPSGEAPPGFTRR